MQWLFENPWPSVVAGAIVALAFGLMFLRSGRTAWLVAMAGVLVSLALLVVVERAVVTDREQVELTLEEIAVALERNDSDKVVDYILPDQTELRGYAKRTL